MMYSPDIPDTYDLTRIPGEWTSLTIAVHRYSTPVISLKKRNSDGITESVDDGDISGAWSGVIQKGITAHLYDRMQEK